MPNWKKVVVSGSDAILSSITSSAGISSSGDIYAPNFIGTATQVSITDFLSGGNLDLVINAGLSENSLFNIPDGLLSYNVDTNTLISNNFSGSLTGTASYATYAENSLDISGNVNNRVLTATGNNTLNAEQNLSFNGSTLELTGSLTVDANNPITIKGQVGNVLTIRNEGSTDIIKIGDVNLNDGETLITVNDNSNTITLDASNKLDINANIDASNYNITASIISASSFIGNLTGTSTLASNLTGTPSIIVNNITASGNISASGDLYSTHVFIPQGINTGDAGLIFGDTITGDSGYIADNDGKLVIGYNDTDRISISDEFNESLLLAGNTRITGHITASKNISASGDIIANNGSFSGDLIVGGNITANQYIVSSSVTYMTQSFSSGSTIFGDTLDDTHQFTGSVDITGSLSIPGFTDVSASLASKGNTNTTGTPLDNQIAVFTNSNTIEGSSDFTFNAGALIVGGGGTTIFNNHNDDATFQIKGSSDDNLLQVNPQSVDKVGIGTATPSEKLTVEGNISASGNLIGSEITASGNISASGNLSADHLILNPNTTTTGSSDNDAAIDISLGEESYKSGVIKRVFDFRENIPSADIIDINNQVIADIGEFTKGTFEFSLELKGVRYLETSSSIIPGTGSIHQSINLSGQTNNEYAIGSAVDIVYSDESNDLLFSAMVELGVNFAPIGSDFQLLTAATQPPFLKEDSGKLKFNFGVPNDVNLSISGSLATVYLNYQLYK